jgi:cytochrome c-type biogenesis protein CcmH/NrfF
MSDERILDEMGTKHSATILVVPAFRGFNTLLWIVPIAAELISVGAMLVTRLWKRR